jgi:hypothetical protein
MFNFFLKTSLEDFDYASFILVKTKPLDKLETESVQLTQDACFGRGAQWPGKWWS